MSERESTHQLAPSEFAWNDTDQVLDHRAYLCFANQDPEGVAALDLLNEVGFAVIIAKVEGFGFPVLRVKRRQYVGLQEIATFVAQVKETESLHLMAESRAD